MNLLIIEGPHASSAGHAPMLAPQAVRGLQSQARARGHTVFHCHCPSVDALLTGLRAGTSLDARMLLLDSGDIAANDPGLPALRETLDHLSMPYIEVHDDSAQVLETYLDLRHAPLATVVFNRDRPGGHALALSIALRRLAMPASGV